MVVIRMRRAGSKNKPFFRIVVTEHAAAREGRFIEILGHYDPRTTPETLVLDRERLAHWMKNGAQPSDTLRTLLDRAPEPAATEAAPAADAPAQS
jgi:small subunit ribosomal protein S16